MTNLQITEVVAVRDQLQAWAETHRNIARHLSDSDDRCKVNTYKADNYTYLANRLTAIISE